MRPLGHRHRRPDEEPSCHQGLQCQPVRRGEAGRCMNYLSRSSLMLTPKWSSEVSCTIVAGLVDAVFSSFSAVCLYVDVLNPPPASRSYNCSSRPHATLTTDRLPPLTALVFSYPRIGVMLVVWGVFCSWIVRNVYDVALISDRASDLMQAYWSTETEGAQINCLALRASSISPRRYEPTRNSWHYSVTSQAVVHTVPNVRSNPVFVVILPHSTPM